MDAQKWQLIIYIIINNWYGHLLKILGGSTTVCGHTNTSYKTLFVDEI